MPAKEELKSVADGIAEVFNKHGFETVAFGVAFSLPPDYKRIHWITNIPRNAGIILFSKVAEKMKMRTIQ